jgi:multiple sugar transport system ATP-binding protein
VWGLRISLRRLREDVGTEVDDRRDVTAKRLASTDDIFLFDCIDDRSVPFGRGDEIAWRRSAQDLKTVIVDQAAMQNGIERREPGIQKDPAVKIAVKRGQFKLVISFGGRDHLRKQDLEIARERTARLREGADDAAALDLLAHLEHLDGFSLRAVGDLRAAMPLADDKAFFLKLKKRLAHCALTASKVGGQIKLRQRGAGRQETEHDFTLQGIEGRSGFGEFRAARPPCNPSGKSGHCDRFPRCRSMTSVPISLHFRRTVPILLDAIIIIDIDIDTKSRGQDQICTGGCDVSGISLRQLRKAYGAVDVIHGIDIEIESGEFLVLVGPSGCGKSTLLRMIAGLEDISGGELEIAGRVVNAVAPSERNIAMVFQDYALYPHMSVRDNMAFGLKMRGVDPAAVNRRVADAADILKIQPLLERRPAQLSGGQRQRVAMGRAIVREPAAFLFDEPLSNLDAALRVEMRLEIAKLHKRMRATTVYVTHDQVEAMTLADRIVVMNGGRIEQIGAPLDLYHTPASLFVARFIGSPTMNTLEAEVVHDNGGCVIKTFGRSIAFPGAQVPAGPAVLGIRPGDLKRCPAADALFEGEISVAERLGSQTFLYVEIDGGQMISVEINPEADVRVGERLSLTCDPHKIHLFDSEIGRRLG